MYYPDYANKHCHSKKSPFVHHVLELVTLILKCRMKQGSCHKGSPYLTEKGVLCGVCQCLFGSSTCSGATILPIITQRSYKNSFSAQKDKRMAARNALSKYQSAYSAYETIYLVLGRPEAEREWQYSW